MQTDFFPDLPRRLTHDEIIAGFAELFNNSKLVDGYVV